MCPRPQFEISGFTAGYKNLETILVVDQARYGCNTRLIKNQNRITGFITRHNLNK